MLRRLLVVLLPLAFLVVGALGVPLATLVAQQRTEEAYVDRLNDVGRFASLADSALGSGRTEALRMELERYEDLYGIPVALLDPSSEVVISSSSGGRVTEALAEPGTRSVLGEALAGYRPEPPTAVWPWDDRPLILAEPVGRDSEVVGAVVLVSPTNELRSAILRDWGALALLELVPLTGLALVAWPVSRWVLRPVRMLDEATAAIAEGDLTVRADSAGGPPELRRLAASFNAMVDVVERALHRQRAFVSDASHQLRNPLASLRLAVENLSPYLTEPDARAAYDDAVEEAKAMNRMLNALLAATRLESFSKAEPVDLDLVLDTRLERWRALAAERGITLKTHIPAGLRLLEPPGGLGSILDELMSNATRLSAGERIVLRARPADPAGGMVEVHVSDDGVGLDPEERQNALRRFWRAPKHQNVVGTGLGLAICAELVQAAGGELALQPGLPQPHGDGYGLDVTVRLPAAPVVVESE
ncbi:HAMP domain-containing sensor histidine kinase [Marinitenerispora sediminis]|uniref:Signal transduction histidine-protein kinase/phosphatase MprB n=1 Tax=Marinitenerispora sediminis TaxID=1931232 RepID=A0A368T4P2_9ACTN|nr:HAMP domain-containing sensor histidine kinase [Marinitenerispora sediminis]RCV57265.1 sensor histidine kinase [Marinitenerispora sediminis]RCV58273.1 sensor histidine kinase [Marinitenerispora sediminis]RCV58495.1 sensor histidine kinase [Marinitenerispora sediminis]